MSSPLRFVANMVILVGGAWVLSANATAIERWQTAQGSTIYLAQRHELPILDIQVLFKGTGGAENRRSANVAKAVADMLVSGTQSLDEEARYARANELAATFESSADSDYSSLSMRIVSTNDRFDEALALMNDMLVRPRFDAAVLKRNQDQEVTTLKQMESQPDYQGWRTLNLLNYPNHPYGWRAKVTEADIRGVTPRAMQVYHRRHYGLDNATVLVVGDADRKLAEKITAAVLAGLPTHSPAKTQVPPVPLQRGQARQVPFANTQQTIVMMGLPLVQRTDPDFLALAVGNYILGGGSFDSRLMQVLRDQYGYTYGASSNLLPMRQKGPLTIGFSTEKIKAEAALQQTRKLLADFIAQGPSEAELQQAKHHLTGAFPMYFDTNAKMAARLTDMALYDLPTDYFDSYPARVMALTPQQIKAAWQRHLNIEDLNIVVVGQ